MKKILVGLALSLIIVLGIAASGCISGEKTSTPSSETTEQKKTTNVVIYGYGSEMITLDPSTEFSN